MNPEKIIEKVRIFCYKTLKGLIKMESFFQIYPEEIEFDRKIPISERKYPLILEIKVNQPKDYFRFGFPKGRGVLDRIVFEFLELITLVLKYYVWGYDHIETLQTFSDQSSRDLTKSGEPKFFQNIRRMDRTVEEILLPKDWEKVIRCYFDLENEELQIARKALKLFYDGIKLEVEYTSLSFVSFISLVETLIAFYFKEIKVKQCKECGQKIFKVRQKFLEFTQRFLGRNDREIKKYLDKLYGLRSSILHQGLLLLSDERSFSGGEFDPERDDYWVRINTTLIVRKILINWIANVEKKKPEEKAIK